MITTSDVVRNIKELYLALKGSAKSTDELAHTINDILIFGQKISPAVLVSAWEEFAKEKGIKNE